MKRSAPSRISRSHCVNRSADTSCAARAASISSAARVAERKPSEATKCSHAKAEVRGRARRKDVHRVLQHPSHEGSLCDRGIEEILGRSRLASTHPGGRHHGPDARSPVQERNEPKPPDRVAFAKDGDLDISLALAGVTPRAPHLREEGRAIEPGDANDRLERSRDHRVSPRRVDHEASFERSRALGPQSLEPQRLSAIQGDMSDLAPFAQLGPAFSSPAKEESVELVAWNLERVVPLLLERLGKRVT